MSDLSTWNPVKKKTTKARFVEGLETMAKEVEAGVIPPSLGTGAAFIDGGPCCVIGHALDRAGVKLAENARITTNTNAILASVEDLSEKERQDFYGGELRGLMDAATQANDHQSYSLLPARLRTFADALKKT